MILTDGGGNPIGQATADGSGNWTFTPGTPLANGTVINAVAQDPAGNTSGPASTTVDAVAPATPVVNPSNGSVIAGTAEAGATVILTDGGGNPIGQATADGSGNWSFTPGTPLANGSVVNAVAQDAAGNTSGPASTTVDSVAPATPVLDPSNGTVISGTAEAGATVILTDGGGNPIGQATADGSGNWSFTPGTPLANGSVINAVAQDAAGNTSGPVSTTVDAVAPATPVIDPSNGVELSGTAEPGVRVILTDGNGNPIGQTLADGSGNWSFTPGTPLANGTVVNAVAQDPAGNTSGPASTTVDTVAPATPVINASNGSVITGTAEVGAKVILTDGNGNPIGETTADGSGNWTFTPGTPLANGTVINAVAEDAAGNTDGNGNPIGQVTADGSGNWSFTPGTPLANGTVVNATASDPTGNTSAPASTTVDSVAPAAPVVNPSNGAEISGTAEPGATVTLTDGSGNPIGQVTADGSGNWSFTPSTPLADGTVVNATATDPAGNTGGQGSTTVDAIAPATPTVNLSNGSSLSGTAEPGSTVILTDGNGNPIAEVTADGSGNWTYTPSTPIANGTVVNVVAEDAAGNSSPPATVTVDSSAPPAPVINPSNGVVISGTAEAGATVTLTDAGGNPIGQVTADGSGNWSFTPGTPLANGTVIVATATDPTGNTGPQAATTVDAVAPPAPVIDPSNGTTISGTAEAGAKVILTDGNGNPIGETTADGSGNWTFTPATPLANGTVVNAVAQDPAGNTGPQGSTTVDAVAPNTPVVNPSNGNLLNGTAEPGSTVTLTDGNGNPIGQTTADGSGNWSFTPGSQLPNGTVVNVTASDAAGNTSLPATTTVDSSLPSIPQVDPSNGSVISGTADAGNTIIITDGNGNPIGQVTADGSGNWSFTPGIPLPDGTVVNVVARSPSNVDSAPAVITVDGVAPAAPVIDPSNGTEISGTAEAGATVILTDGGGNPIGQATADGSGNWTFTPGTPLANGTVINAVAQDPAGNTSGPASVTVDAIAPPAPVIDPSNGVVISGTAEAGATVILTDGNGNPVGQVTADGSGNWAFTPATPLANGTVINALAQDAAGNNSSPTSATVDSLAPAAPVIDPSNGSVIAGTAEAGATVILTDGNGNPIGQVTADGSGNWSFTPGTPLSNGTVVNAVAQDAAGNTSGPASTTVDSVAPAAPVIDPSNGSVIAGTAEAGATVILTDGGGNPIGQATADGSGNWTFTPGTPLANGTVINAVAQDPAGNTSGPASTTVDAVAPATPVVNPSNGSVIAGTAEAGATVILTDGGGNPIGQATADGSGNWSFTPGTPLANGSVVNAVAQDAAGNTSGPASTTVDSVAPATPVLDPSNGTVISGTAEAGATVILTDGGGNPIGQATADGSGNWSFTPGTPLANGSVINAVAQDAAGNTSGPVSTTVDAVAPATPVIDPSNGVELSGTAEPGVRVILTDGNGNPIGQTLADGSGNWSFTPGTPLANGTVVNAVAQDPAGNTSGPASTTVDTVAPATPVINASNGSVITGTAEVGAKVILTDGNGNPIGETTADGSGNWTFTPGTPLANGTVINAVAEDAAGNTDGNGNPIGQVTADGSGNWTFTPSTPLPNGTVVNATATDPSGNASPPASVTVDAVAPATPVVNPSNGSTLSGTAEPGATVTLTDGNGDPIGQVTADGSGNWSFTPTTPLPNGTVVNATATDASGNTSAGSSVTVDSVAPATPVVNPSNGTTLSGTAEPGSSVTLTDGNGNPIGQVTADGSGNWSFTPSTPLADGTVVNATATDPAGNTSGQGSTTVDGVAPATPTVNLSNGSSLSGTAEPGSTVILTDGNGNPIAEVTADGSGNWTYTPSTPIANGTVVNVVAQDAAGNNSPGASVTVDSQAPAAPVLNPSNGTTLSGTAEPGATVTLTDGNGNPIGQVTADGSGNWSFTPGTPLANGTVVNATASDPTGNTSAPASTTVDSVAPAAPVVNPSNGAEISGTAEPGATVTLTDGSGNPIGQVTADGSGNWSFTPSTPLADGTVVNATATDPAGNTGGQGSTTVDAIAPATPTVNLSNGSSLSGTAEPGSTVILTDGNGNPIAEVTADGSGNWTYTPSTPIANGTVVNVVAEDAAGNSSPPATVTVDSSAPPAPVINPSNGVVISGTAEAGATVTLTDAGGNPIGQVTADGSGNWSFTPGTPLANGTVIVATATDPTGNTGPQAATTVDAVAPPAPVIDPSNGTTISGTAEAGAKVILTDGNGNPIGETTADGSGNWTFTPATPLANGTVVNADAPQVNASNGSVLSGTAEAGVTIVITDGNGNPIGQTSADANGNWSFTPGSQLPDGTVVNVVARDAAGNSSPATSITVDGVAPNAPVVEPSNGSELSGTAEPGSSVTLTDGNGNPIGQTTADANGNWSFTPSTPLPDGTVVNVVARDAAGNSSPPASVTVDAVAPATPTVDPSNGTTLSGTAEPGATVTLTDGNGNPIGQVTADGSGNWTFTPSTPLPNGTVVNATATDPSGNASPPASVTVDAVAPATPVVNPSNGSTLSGTAEPGATVTLTDGNGDPIGQVTADGSGNWSFTPTTPLPNGTVVNATATDASGNTSAGSSVTVDSVAPATPVVNPSNGTTLSGTAEPGSSVTLTDGNGNPIGQVTADGSGNWSFTPSTPLADGTVVNATATDPAGNTSGQGSTTVDGVAPATPTVNLSNGSSLSGTAEPGSTVILTDGNGNPIAEVTADGSGNWTYTPSTPIANGTVVNVVAQDAAGNNSPGASVTVDSQAPAAPVLNPSNGTTLSGTAEPGATVTLTDGNGNPIGQVTADGSGNWSFTPGTPLANGTVVNATASDPTGNTSAPASTTVDSVAPAAPVVNPSNGAEISGTAEPGATVTLTDGSGNPIGQVTADGSGNWSFTPSTPLADGTVVNATATDPAGNTTDGNGNPIGQTSADANGNWSFTPGSQLPDGTVVNVVARDAAGNSSPATSITVDGVAPNAPVVEPSNGSELSGTAEPGSSVTLTDGNGNPIGQTTADANGNWSFTPSTPLPDGTVVNVVARDAAGNSSPPASVTVDAVAPATPTVDPSNGTTLSGTAEPGATVTLTDGNGNPIGQVTADGSGNWTFTPSTPLPNGTVVNATATDPSGNASPPASVTVDAVAPATPVVNPSNGSTLSGTAEPGATVTLTDGNGDPIGQVTADGSGNWSFTPTTPLPNGTVVNATATDASGNTSAGSSVTVDSVAPATPVVNPSNGTTLSGTAEPGSSVTLTDGNGNPIGQVTADGSGNWSFTPSTPLADGTVVNATATDPAGNTSGQGSTTVDGVAPATPTVNLSNGSSLSGTAEPGSTVILTDGNGNPIAEVTADGSGNWTYTPSTPIANGTVVNVVAQDAAGNNSPGASVTVDSQAPAAPVLNPSNGTTLSGTAEPGATVTLTDGNGNPIGQVTADGSGNWSFTPGTPLANGTVVNATASDPTGNTSAPASTTVEVNASNGSVLSGTAEAGVTIVITDGNGNPIGQTSADANGNWSFTPGSQLPDGTVVNVVARDAAGNSSPATSITVDGVAPNAPVVEPSNGSELSGTAEPGSSVTLTDGNGNPIGQTTADANGNWSFTPSTPLPDGTVVNVVARDAAGNSSPPASVTVDAVAPATPTVDPSNGTTLSGTAEPGATVTLTDGNGNPIGQVTADGSGNWTFTPSTPLPNGTVVNATATDPSGNASPPASVTVDAVAPATPVVNPSNGSTLSGTAEPGATVTLTDGNGDPIGQVTADGSGNWSFTPTTPLPNGTVVNATATDASGNTSAGSSVTVDSVAPATPVVNPSNGTTLSGTAEPGSSVTLTDGNGNPIGQVTADGSGNWSFTPSTPLADGTVVNATATDPAGNTSGQGSTTVDGVAPATPTVNLSNGSSLSGTAEPGSTVILTDGNGNPIAEVTADGSGNWTYTPSTPIANGTVVNVVAQDAAGNNSRSMPATAASSAVRRKRA
ncbi:hypothetical protein ACS96_30835 [Pseudomonas aeruginosa]|nr:hypothetical protein ACS96_30835 [Pseudomonas aeruginosa]